MQRFEKSTVSSNLFEFEAKIDSFFKKRQNNVSQNEVLNHRIEELEEELKKTVDNHENELDTINLKSRVCPLFKNCGGNGNTKTGPLTHYIINNCPFYNEVCKQNEKNFHLFSFVKLEYGEIE